MLEQYLELNNLVILREADPEMAWGQLTLLRGEGGERC